MLELVDLLCEKLRAGQPVTMGTVVRQEGSTPRGAGSKLLADATGLLCGTVGGGLAEWRTLETCRQALEQRSSLMMDINLTGELAAGMDMICGGRLRVLAEPVYPDADTLELFEALRELLPKGGATLITRLGAVAADAPQRTLVSHGSCSGAELSEAVRQVVLPRLERPFEDPWVLCMPDGTEYFVEPWFPAFRMIIAGGGHVSRPTAQVAAVAGFAVTVLDDREEFSRPERFPWALSVRQVPEFMHCFDGMPMDSRTCVVIVTRGHMHDATVLVQALATNAGYVGMIGSRRKKREVYESLRRQGVPDAALERVCCPIGLEIHAETPEEIAVSIVAECIAYKRRVCAPA